MRNKKYSEMHRSNCENPTPPSVLRNPRPELGSKARNSKGFTLIEIVITIVIVGIIAGIAAGIITQGVRAYSDQQSRSDVHYQGRVALERMAREIRQIRARTAADITTWDTVTLEYFNITGTQVGFRLSGGNIERRENMGAWAVIARNVTATSNILFTYLDNTGVATTDLAALWYIRIEFTATTGSESYTLRTRVHPRNFQ